MDRGESYRPVIYYYSDTQKEIAEASKKALEESGKYKDPIVVTIEEAPVFYRAEDEHQDFYRRNKACYQQEKEERAAWVAKNHN